MKKQLLVILLSVAVLFTFTPTIALAETEASERGTGEEIIAAPAGGFEYHSDGLKYRYDDGSYASGWALISDYYYYFDPATKVAVTGWKKIGGYWYYFAKNGDENGYSEGQMYDEGALKVNGKWYYFGLWNGPAAKWGKMQYKWIKETDDGETLWYYADPNKDGQLALGWKKIDGKWYYFEPSESGDTWFKTCQMYSNDTGEIGGKLYAFNRDGSLHETAGWVDLYEEYTDKNGDKVKESYWVYTDKNGIAATGWKKISGEWYLFDDWGYMQHDCPAEDSVGYLYLGSNGKPYKSKWLKYDGWWYYFNASGYMVADKWLKIDGEWYCFNEYGQMLYNQWVKDSVGWMWLGANGKPYRSKWLYDENEGEWHYLKANGYEATNEWAKDSKGWMYMGGDGTPLKDQPLAYNGDLYYLDVTGYMVTSDYRMIGKDEYYFDATGKGKLV